MGAVLELPAKQHCQFSPFGPLCDKNGLDWQCYLAGSSKTAPMILIFSIAIGADYSYEVKNSEIWAPAFFKHNNSFIAAVTCDLFLLPYFREQLSRQLFFFRGFRCDNYSRETTVEGRKLLICFFFMQRSVNLKRFFSLNSIAQKTNEICVWKNSALFI